MSGQAPAVNGMVGFRHDVDWKPSHTLAGELTRAGYQTEMVGKFHLYPHRKRYGFEHLRLSDSHHAQNNDYTDWLMHAGAVPFEAGRAHGVSGNGWVGRPDYLPEHQTHAFWCVSQALDFLRKRDPTTPFFLNISFVDPHPPLTPPRFYYDRYISQVVPMPVVGDWAPPFAGPEKGLDINASILCLDEAAMRCARAGYFGLINHVDDQLGRLISFLQPSTSYGTDVRQRQSLFDNTFILFTSDHGEMLGDHNLFRKTFAYEASARVPFFVLAPRSMDYPAEVVSAAPVGLQDVMPTLLDAAGVRIPETVSGRSLLPLMRGSAREWREVLHGEHAGRYRYEDGMQYLTDGHVKYVWHTQTGLEHLFDLDEDPCELHDQALREDAVAQLAPWRERLVARLKDRPEGFTDGERLIVGQPHEAVVPGQVLA